MAHTTYIQTHGTSYYLANLLFPRRLRDEVSTLYAMVRIVDDIVDDAEVDHEMAAAQVHSYHQLYDFPSDTPSTIPEHIMTDTRRLADENHRPIEWVDAFFAAMIADTKHQYYQTYSDLQEYMR